VLLASMLPRPLDANIYEVLHVVQVCGLLNVVCMSFGRVWWSAATRNARRRPKKAMEAQ